MTRRGSCGYRAHTIGLTGNIATGKSSVAKLLGQLGAHVIDADKVAHDVMRSGREAWQRVVARFGSEILGADGEIDRRVLGDIVFADPAALRDLESIVHPAVLAEVDRRISAIVEGAVEMPIIVVEAIKLVESGMHACYDALWVVTCSPEQQEARLMARSRLSEEAARLRIEAQSPAAANAALADVLIDNDGAWVDAERQVRSAWKRAHAAALDKTR